MDSAKVKELISKDRDAHSDGYARMLLKGVLKKIEDFEAAEREQWKELPPCIPKTHKKVGCAYDWVRCKFRKIYQEGPGQWYMCAHPWIARLQKVDTAFSAKLSEYLEKVDMIDNQLRGHLRWHVKQRRKQEDDQLEEGERE